MGKRRGREEGNPEESWRSCGMTVEKAASHTDSGTTGKLDTRLFLMHREATRSYSKTKAKQHRLGIRITVWILPAIQE